MNHSCVTEYLQEQSIKVRILKNYFLLCPVPPRNSLKKRFELLKQLQGTLVSFDCFVLIDHKTRKIIDIE